jgi:phosphoribosylanthranilate isomerase
MWIKICGLRTADTVDAAVAVGVDAVGFVFAPGSPRTIRPADARSLVGRVPDGVETVGVFRDQPVGEILRSARQSGVTTVQLHGHEGPDEFEAVRQGGFAVIRAISAARFVEESLGRESPHLGAPPVRLAAWQPARPLLDAPDPGAGLPFAENSLAGAAPPAGWILAGGLTVGNVGRLVEAFRPARVDVSSGVESSRGIKSAGLIRSFVAAARSAEPSAARG